MNGRLTNKRALYFLLSFSLDLFNATSSVKGRRKKERGKDILPCAMGLFASKIGLPASRKIPRVTTAPTKISKLGVLSFRPYTSGIY